MSKAAFAALLLIVFATLAQAATTTTPCQISANIATISRDGLGVVTASVVGLGDFVKAGDAIVISGVPPVNVSGNIVDLDFNGPFTLGSVDRLSGSATLSWIDPGTEGSSGGGVVLPAVGTPSLVVQFSSSQFSVAPASDPNSAYAFSYGSMAELTDNGSVEKGHKINISGNVTDWSQPYTNGTYTLVQLCGDFAVGQNTATSGPVRLEANHFIYPWADTVQNGDQMLAVPADSVKFDLDLPRGWPFASLTNSLQVQLHIKVPGQIEQLALTTDANKSIAHLAAVVSHGPALQLSFPATVLVDGTKYVGTSDGYFVDAKTSDTGIELFVTFPHFLTGIHWSSVVHLAQ